MTNKNPLRGKLLNVDVLNVSMNVIKDMLGLESASNVEYSDEMIVYHLLNACASQTSVNQVSNICVDSPSEGTIRHKLRNIDLDGLKPALNEKLKDEFIKIVPRKSQYFAIDFVNIPYYGDEENKGNTIKTKPKQGTSRLFAYASIYLILGHKRFTFALK